MKQTFRRLSLVLGCGLISSAVFAWNHSVEIGYGFSHDPNHTRYNNSGILLSGDLLPLRRTPWTFWSITGSIGRFYTTTPKNKNLTTAALSIALRFYPFMVAKEYPAYLLASFGPAALSSRRYGYNTQAQQLTIQSNIGVGVEFKQVDLNLRLSHYSNASLGKPNEGFNLLYLLSVGYLF